MNPIKRLLGSFLPANPDVLGMLCDQAEVTVAGMAAFVGWATGDPEEAHAVRDAEHAADEEKRQLLVALQNSFITPIGAEDIFVLSTRLDAVLGGAKDAVREAEVTALVPDEATLVMVQILAQAVDELRQAFEALRSQGRHAHDATVHAETARKTVRGLERAYREAMRALLASDDLREVMNRRELYRRLARMADDVIEVAERIGYAAIKET